MIEQCLAHHASKGAMYGVAEYYSALYPIPISVPITVSLGPVGPVVSLCRELDAAPGSLVFLGHG